MKYIMAIPETTLKLFEVEVDTDVNVPSINKDTILESFRNGGGPRLKETYVGTCRVGEYRDRATILAEVPAEVK